MNETPVFKKCCFCVPLKACLHTWVVFKFILDISIACMMGFILLVFMAFDPKLTEYKMMIILVIPCIICLVDIVFVIILSVGLCKGSASNVSIFYHYNLTMIVFECITFICVVIRAYMNVKVTQYNNIRQQQQDQIIGVTYITIYIVLDICVALTVKSELVKLRNAQNGSSSTLVPQVANSEKTTQDSIEKPILADV